MKKHKRRLFLNVNKFQRRILYPALFFCFVSFFLSFFNLLYAGYLEHSLNRIHTLGVDNLQMVIPWYYSLLSYKIALPWFLFSALTMLCLMVYWIYYVSSKIIGPYDRILKGLDNIIDGDKEHKLSVRKKDEMFDELVKKINTLCKKIQ